MADLTIKAKKEDTPIIVSDNKPVVVDSGQVIINKKSTAKHIEKLIEINKDTSEKVEAKVSNDGTDGGLLKGKPHYDKNGNPTGGMPAIVDGQKQIEVEGNEFVVNKEASQKHWKELSKINQDGGGVPIGKPAGADDNDSDPEEYKDGGLIKFNANKTPNSNIIKYGLKIKKEYPEIWDRAGNIFGNTAFENLLRVHNRGYWLDDEKWMYIKWQSYIARHQKDYLLNGVIAMLKWGATVSRGWPYMKSVIEEQIKKEDAKKMKEGGSVDSERVVVETDSTELLAPNGQPSNLTPDQYKIVRSSAFIKWFGDWMNNPESASQAVDANGEPMVVYHATPHGKFNEFKGRDGLFFSESKKFALYYAEDKSFANEMDETPTLYSCFLNIRNMFNPNNPEHLSQIESILPDQVEIGLFGKGFPKDEFIEGLKGNFTIPPYWSKDKIEKATFGKAIGEARDGFNNDVFIGIDKDNNVVYAANYQSDYVKYLSPSQVQDLLAGQIVEINSYVVDGLTYTKEELLKMYNDGDISERKWLYAITNKVRAKINPYKHSQDIQYESGQDTWQLYELNNVGLFEKIRDLGFDGIRVQERGEKNIVVFKGNQVKLADGVNITFNSETNDIRYEDGGFTKRNLTYLGQEGANRLGIEKEDFVNVYDNKKRFEISDHDIFLILDFDTEKERCIRNEGEEYVSYLPSVLSHSKLFAAYPELKKWKFVYTYNPYISDFALLKTTQNAIIYNFHKEDEYYKGVDGEKFLPSTKRGGARLQAYTELRTKVLLHELQHFIQLTEEMAKGSSVKYEFRRLYGRMANDSDGGLSDHHENLRMERAAHEYDMQAGELEARDVERRMKLTPEERKSVEPFGKTKNESVNVRFKDGGIAKSLLAPNGNMSNLNGQQWQLVRTPEFKAWFGDWENDPKSSSKIVDENGEPLVVYHGTTNHFNKFDINKIGHGSGNHGHYGYGFYFTDEINEARTYGSVIKKCFLNLRNPFLDTNDNFELLKKEGIHWIDDQVPVQIDLESFYNEVKRVDPKIALLIEYVNNHGYEKGWELFLEKNNFKDTILDPNDIIDIYNYTQGENGVPDEIVEGGSSKWDCGINFKNLTFKYGYLTNPVLHWITNLGERSKEVTDAIKSAGFDGVASAEYVAFDPNQIKLADGSNTKFNSDSDDIRFKVGGTASASVLLAPNGVKSNLNEDQWKLVRTPAFKKWFGDWENDPENASKVVDKNGEPMVVYHGSSNDFNVFEKHKMGSRNEEDQGMIGKGFYFSENKHYSVKYGNIVKPYFLNCRNIYDTEKNPDNIIGEIWTDTWEPDEMTKAFIENGYDCAFINYDRWQGMEYVCFNPNQIKLADGTNTTFKNADPDTRFEDGGFTSRNLTYIGQEGANKIGIEKEDFVNVYDEKKRFEISDHDVSLILDFNHLKDILKSTKQEKVLPLSDVISHPFLFEAYPEAKLIKVAFSFRPSDERFALYNKENNVILYNLYGEDQFIDTISGDLGDLFRANERGGARLQAYTELRTKVLLHELQHFIQLTEEMAKGSTVDREFRRLFGQMGTDSTHKGFYSSDGDLRMERAAHEYEMQAGELEARDVEKRMKLTPEEGKSVEPFGKNKIDGVNVRFGNGGLIAPNGQKSNLNAEQYKLVRTPEFKKWFGDWENDPKNASKVVDENGEPMVCYHGTDNNFHTFDKSKIGDNHWQGKSDVYGGGFFFTDKKNKAFRGNIYDVFLKIENPLMNILEDKYGYEVDYYHATDNFDLNSTIYFQKTNENGNNGIIIKTPRGSLYVAFEPNQIKLADGTNTTFNTDSGDIRFEDGGMINEEAQQLIDIVSMNPTLDKYQKYKVVLKDQYGIDFDLIYKDQDYIDNATLNDIKGKDDFFNFDNWLKYAKLISTKRGFIPMDLYWKGFDEVTDEDWNNTAKKLNFTVKKVEYEERGTGSGDVARAMADRITYTKEADLYYFLHEIGHVYDFQNHLTGVIKNPAYSPTNYGTTHSGETFAENFAIYFINPNALKSWNRDVYAAMDLIINDKYKKELNRIVFEKTKYEKGGQLKKGIAAEKEHMSTARKLYDHKITPNEAPKYIALDHLKESPKYYDLLEDMESKFANGGKVDYNKKAEYANRIMAKNNEVDTLNEEQHACLSVLCAVRHKLHTNQDRIIKGDDSVLRDLCSANSQIVNSGLPKVDAIPLDHYEFEFDTIPVLESSGEAPHSGTDEYNDWYNKEYTRIYGILEALNGAVEDYLSDIDSKHGTQYKPTGHSRLYEDGGEIKSDADLTEFFSIPMSLFIKKNSKHATDNSLNSWYSHYLTTIITDRRGEVYKLVDAGKVSVKDILDRVDEAKINTSFIPNYSSFVVVINDSEGAIRIKGKLINFKTLLGSKNKPRVSKDLVIPNDLNSLSVEELRSLISKLEDKMSDFVKKGDKKKLEKGNEILGELIDLYNKKNRVLMQELTTSENSLYKQMLAGLGEIDLTRTLRIANNIASLDGGDGVRRLEHFAEAIQYTGSDVSGDEYGVFYLDDLRSLVKDYNDGYANLIRAIRLGVFEGQGMKSAELLKDIKRFKEANAKFLSLPKEKRAIFKTIVDRMYLEDERDHDEIKAAMYDVCKFIERSADKNMTDFMLDLSKLHDKYSKDPNDNNFVNNSNFNEGENKLLNRLIADTYNGVKYNKVQLEKTAREYGVMLQKDAKELAELSISFVAREYAHKLGLSNRKKYDLIVDLYKNQVNLSHRTSSSINMNQYSTPAPMGYIAGLFCGMDKRGLYFEPSAGNGLLTSAGEAEDFIVNELDKFRNRNLHLFPYKEILMQDALLPFVGFEKKFDAIITNPPFGKTESVVYGRTNINVLEHVMALKTLETMKDNGKAAIIIGGHTAYDKDGLIQQGKNRSLFIYLHRHYNVVDCIQIDGSALYSRQGTSFDTRMILIRGRKSNPEGLPPIVKEDTPMEEVMSRTPVNNYKSLWERVNKSIS
jgi:hypothetical protein